MYENRICQQVFGKMVSIYGLKFILAGFILTVAVGFWAAARDALPFFVIAAVFGILTLFLVYFYRNPERKIPSDENLILSIADGKVLSIESIENDFIGGRGSKVSIFMSVVNAHINRMPVSGQLDYVKYIPGKFFKAFVDKASEENEHTEIGIIFGNNRLIFKQIAGIMARRIVCNARPQQRVKAGEIFGMIHFGSRAELFLPENIEVFVKKGDKVKAGQSVIGRLID